MLSVLYPTLLANVSCKKKKSEADKLEKRRGGRMKEDSEDRGRRKEKRTGGWMRAITERDRVEKSRDSEGGKGWEDEGMGGERERERKTQSDRKRPITFADALVTMKKQRATVNGTD